MIVTSLKVKRFRNLNDILITPTEGLNVICGENGQGKTNILEAMWLFTGSGSFRRSSEKEMIPFEGKSCDVSITIQESIKEDTLHYILGEEKRIERNLVKEKKLADFSSYFNAVIFSPDHMLLVKGGPIERRKSLDLVISQLKPRYQVLLSQYSRMLIQRNSLLKQYREKKASISTLEEWDRSLAKAGSLITKTRKSYADLIIPKACEIYSGISSNKEKLEITYQSWAEEKEITAENLYIELLTAREKDIAIAQTTIGAHRDDLNIKINQKSARDYASQGQQRSIVLSLKLAECEIIEDITQKKPIILLDDVLSELDYGRREFLLKKLSDCQIFLTCCDFNQIKNVFSVIKIGNGGLM